MADDFFFQPDNLFDVGGLFDDATGNVDLSQLGNFDNSGFGVGFGYDPNGGGDFGGLDLSNIDPSTIGLLNSIGYGTPDFSGGDFGSIFGGLGSAISGSKPSGTSGGTGGNGGSGGGLGGLLNSLGGLGGILPSLLALGSGLMGQHATNQATQQTVNGINAASDQAKQLIGAAQANYAPFTANVGQSLAKLAAPVNLAGNFKPLGSGKYGG